MFILKFSLVFLILIWLFVIIHIGAFGLFGGNNALVILNKKIKSIYDVFYFKSAPNVYIEQDVPPSGNAICQVPVAVLDESINCTHVCKNENGELFQIVEGQLLISYNEQLAPGYYCRLSDDAICNPFTTIIIYTNIGWSCYNKTAYFGGTGGNKILICNGSLKDRATETTYENYIPHTLPITDIDEMFQDDYRFKCVNDFHPITNYRLSSFGIRLSRITNPCTIGIENSIDSIWDPFSSNNQMCTCDESILTFSTELNQCIAHPSKAFLRIPCHERYIPRLKGLEFLGPCMYGPFIHSIVPQLPITTEPPYQPKFDYEQPAQYLIAPYATNIQEIDSKMSSKNLKRRALLISKLENAPDVDSDSDDSTNDFNTGPKNKRLKLTKEEWDLVHIDLEKLDPFLHMVTPKQIPKYKSKAKIIEL
jgi:hypothetical protein